MSLEELQNAFTVAEISKNEYDLAISESEKLMTEISENKFVLFNLCQSHRQALLQTVEVM